MSGQWVEQVWLFWLHVWGRGSMTFLDPSVVKMRVKDRRPRQCNTHAHTRTHTHTWIPFGVIKKWVRLMSDMTM